jgi:hypothetical protein
MSYQPAAALPTGGFNPAGSVPGFGGLGPSLIRVGGTDLGNLLGNSGGPLGKF